uniref:Uncharacterized protein n=1 Tax=Anguilla anguilla TaxID=7936 RepID=A0A0E9TNM0_ANGAN
MSRFAITDQDRNWNRTLSDRDFTQYSHKPCCP